MVYNLQLVGMESEKGMNQMHAVPCSVSTKILLHIFSDSESEANSLPVFLYVYFSVPDCQALYGDNQRLRVSLLLVIR